MCVFKNVSFLRGFHCDYLKAFFCEKVRLFTFGKKIQQGRRMVEEKFEKDISRLS